MDDLVLFHIPIFIFDRKYYDSVYDDYILVKSILRSIFSASHRKIIDIDMKEENNISFCYMFDDESPGLVCLEI